MTLPKYATRPARKGAILLDNVWPGWWRKVRIRRLNMVKGSFFPAGKGCGCVLAQLAPIHSPGQHYDDGLEQLRDKTRSNLGETTYGFNLPKGLNLSDQAWENLTEAWREEIRSRRNKPARG